VYQVLDAGIRFYGERLRTMLDRPGPVSTPEGLVWPDELPAEAWAYAKLGDTL
jgi:hypothetical protein